VKYSLVTSILLRLLLGTLIQILLHKINFLLGFVFFVTIIIYGVIVRIKLSFFKKNQMYFNFLAKGFNALSENEKILMRNIITIIFQIIISTIILILFVDKF